MGPTVRKRRSGEEEGRRPKKRIKNFKKQKSYHSSSEDDSEDEQPAKNNALRISVATKKDAQQGPKKPTIPQQPETSAADESDDSDEVDDVQINTILNMEPADESEDEEAQDEEAQDDDEEAEQDDEEESDDDGGVQIDNLDDLSSDDDNDLVDDFDSDDASTTTAATRKKRNDPTAFATSISKILTTKLSTQKRSDPILSRSKTADEANKALADEKLETKARASIRAEKRSLLERGRVKDVLGLETPEADTGAIMEHEKRLKKTAQRGVVKLFNAVRAAQIKGEEAARAARDQGVIGIQKREEHINEMSKEGFLDLISRGGTTVES